MHQVTPNVVDCVLVTGATGFVGSAVVSAIAAQESDLQAVAATRRPASVPRGTRSVRITDLGPDTDWSEALRGVSHIVHCAARVHVMDKESDRVSHEYQRVNRDATLALARQAAAANVRRFIFLSSVKVSGEASRAGRPLREDDPPDPHDPYAWSKLEAEDGLKNLGGESLMEMVVIRPALVYGPGVKGNFHSMMRWITKGVPLPFALVENRRSFLGLSNLVDLILVCLAHPHAAHETFLASDGTDVSTPELLRKTAAALGRPARLVPVPLAILLAGAHLMRADQQAHRLLGSLQVDISKARNLLGWSPQIAMDSELARTAAHFIAAERND